MLKMEYNLTIDEEGVKINDTLINEAIFQKEMVDFTLIERKDQIDHLIEWIGEVKPNDRELMKEDLKYLMDLDDEYIFSSILTNEYIAKSDDEESFNQICEEILELNEKLGIRDIEDFNLDELKDELLKVYDELLNRGFSQEDLFKWIQEGKRLR
jgi:succinate dehydrogenase flavin-adding protein (antitoxin of CptAB toxin-antitoxin module)